MITDIITYCYGIYYGLDVTNMLSKDLLTKKEKNEFVK